MVKYVPLSDLISLTNEQTAINTTNTNNQRIEDALTNTLSRDGSSPNQMLADLDMNSNQIINLPAATTATEPVRKAEFDSVVLGEFSNTVGTSNIVDGAVTWDKIAGSVATISELQTSSIANDVDLVYVRGYHVEGTGAHLRKRSATLPAHSAYVQDASGAYFEVTSGIHSIEVFGGKGDDVTFDNAPAMSAFLSWSLITQCRKLTFLGKRYMFLTRPDAATASVTFEGSGVNATYLFVNYAEDNAHGFFHLLPVDTANLGLIVKDMTLYSTRATPSGGNGIYAASGNRWPITIGGTATEGDELTLTYTVDGTPYAATYTVQNGDTLRDIALGLETASSTVLTGGAGVLNWSSGVSQNVLHTILPDTMTISIVSSTSLGATATVTVGSMVYSVAGNIFWSKIRISGNTDGWFCGIFIDGRNAAVNYGTGNAYGVRTIRGSDFEIFGGQFGAAAFLVTHVLALNGCSFIPAGGSGANAGRLVLSGNTSASSFLTQLDVAYAGNVYFGNCNHVIGQIVAGYDVTVESFATQGRVDMGSYNSLTNNSTTFDIVLPRVRTTETFTSSGTWTKPVGIKGVEVTVVSGGAGGGSGRRGAAGTVRTGGGGGASGGLATAYIPASLLPSSVTVTVGAGGTGGVAMASDDNNGNPGNNGGVSSFGAHVSVPASTGGAAGNTTTTAGGTAGLAMFGGASGAAASATGGIGGNGQRVAVAAGSGGAGGGITSANSASAGGSGSSFGACRGVSSVTPSGGGIDTNGTDGTSVTLYEPFGGGGGSGGGAYVAGAAGRGGNGGFPGGGGGGGGASLNGTDSGAGGNGGAGCVLVKPIW